MNGTRLFFAVALCSGLVWAAYSAATAASVEQAGDATTARAEPRNSARRPLTVSSSAASSDAGESFGFAPYEEFRPLVSCGDNCQQYVPSFEVVRIGDITGDGRDDLVAMTTDNSFWVLKQRVDGTLDMDNPLVFQYGDRVYSQPTHELLLGDVNEDGVLDIVASSIQAVDFFPGALPDTGGLNVVLSDGAGGLVFNQISADYDLPWSQAEITDVDLDGHLDVIGYQSGYSVRRKVFFGDGHGAFPRTEVTELGLQLAGAGIADFNGDGIPDLATLVASDIQDGRPHFNIHYHDGSSGYRAPVRITPLSEMLVANAFGDFNHDGRADIATGAQSYGIYVLLQNGPSSFAAPYGLPTAYMHPEALLSADLDRDRLTDLLSPQFSSGTAWYYMQVYLQRDGMLEPLASPGPPLGENFTPNEKQLAAGDLDSDGCTDVAMPNGQSGVTIFHGMNCRQMAAVTSDFNGDSQSDVFWRNHDTGANAIWKSASLATRQAVSGVANLAWEIAGTGDFNGNRKTDILWRNRSTGSNAIWESASLATPKPIRAVVNTAWEVAGIGDFNGDLKSDVLWRNRSTGQNVIWKSANAALAQQLSAVTSPAWKIAGIGDFDGDGKSDILWRNTSTGANAIWKSGNAATAQALTGLANQAWKIVGVGDFNGDAKSDILWRNTTTGANAIWKSGNAATAQALYRVTNLEWQVADIGDYDNDGKADIFWRNSLTGTNVIWRAANAASQRPMKPISPAWQVAR